METSRVFRTDARGWHGGAYATTYRQKTVWRWTLTPWLDDTVNDDAVTRRVGRRPKARWFWPAL